MLPNWGVEFNLRIWLYKKRCRHYLHSVEERRKSINMNSISELLLLRWTVLQISQSQLRLPQLVLYKWNALHIPVVHSVACRTLFPHCVSKSSSWCNLITEGGRLSWNCVIFNEIIIILDIWSEYLWSGSYKVEQKLHLLYKLKIQPYIFIAGLIAERKLILLLISQGMHVTNTGYSDYNAFNM